MRQPIGRPSKQVSIAIGLILIFLIVAGDIFSFALSGRIVNHAVVFFISGSLTVSTTAGNINIFSPFKMICTEVHAKVNTAPAGASVKINVLFNAATIFVTSTEPAIPAGSTTASVTLTGSDTTVLAKNVDVTINIDQIGSVTPGSDLVVEVRCHQ